MPRHSAHIGGYLLVSNVVRTLAFMDLKLSRNSDQGTVTWTGPWAGSGKANMMRDLGRPAVKRR